MSLQFVPSQMRSLGYAYVTTRRKTTLIIIILQAMFEALEETITDLKQQLREKEAVIDELQDSLHTKTIENDNLKKLLNSEKHQKSSENVQEVAT